MCRELVTNALVRECIVSSSLSDSWIMFRSMRESVSRGRAFRGSRSLHMDNPNIVHKGYFPGIVYSSHVSFVHAVHSLKGNTSTLA